MRTVFLNLKSWLAQLLLLGIASYGCYWQLMMLTEHKGKDVFQNPYHWFVAGLVCVVAALISMRFAPKEEENNTKPFLAPIPILFTLAAMVLCAANYTEVIAQYKMDAVSSDVLPSLKLYATRFLSYERVYTTLVFPSHSVSPTYFPFMWLPYVLAEYWGMDYRWIPFGFIFLAIVAYLFRSKSNWKETIFTTFIVGFFAYTLRTYLRFSPEEFYMSVEMTPTALYFFMALTIFDKRAWVVALGLAICILSRYSLVLWVPFYGILLWRAYGFTFLRNVALIGVGLVAVFYLPFIMHDLSIPIKGFKEYATGMRNAWRMGSWQQTGELPYHISKGIGFSHFFYEKAGHDVELAIHWNKIAQMIAILSSLLTSGILYFFLHKKSWFNLKTFAKASLSLYFLCFTGFIFAPYSYLFQLAFFFNFVLLFEIVSPSKKQEKID